LYPIGCEPAIRVQQEKVSQGGVGEERQLQLFVMPECTGIHATHAKHAGELGGVTVQGENLSGLDPMHHRKEFREVGVIADRKRGVGPVSETATGIHGPSGDHRGATGSEGLTELVDPAAGGSDDDMTAGAGGFGGVEPGEGGEGATEFLIDPGDACDRFGDPDGEARMKQAGEQFLGFAEGIGEEDGDLIEFQGFSAEPDDIREDPIGGGEDKPRFAEGGFHDENVGVDRVTGFGGQTGSELEIAGVEERTRVGFDQGHGGAEDMTGGKQGEVGGTGWTKLRIPEVDPFMEAEDVFLALAGHTGAHESPGGFGGNDPGMTAGVIGMGMGDDDQFVGADRLMGIEPEPESGKVQTAADEVEIGAGHPG
jgi:hypothetical protein